MNESKFSILQALALMLVVISQAGTSCWPAQFLSMFSVPAFFLCAGYLFDTGYLTDERTFVVERIKRLYLPFVSWSVVLLLLHNLLLACGLLSTHYGSVAGEVSQSYTLHQTAQQLWSIVFNMSGYSPLLGEMFWVFRALLLSAISFLILFKLLRRSPRFATDKQAGWALLVIGLLLTTWKVADGVTVTGVAQGGYRELMGLTLMAAGFQLRQYRLDKVLTWRIAAPAAAVLLVASLWCPSSMVWNPDFAQFSALPLPAVAGFVLLLYASAWIDRMQPRVKHALTYVGERAPHVLAFHLLSFKAVSAIAVACLGLPWEAIGCHPVVHECMGQVGWVLLYVVAGLSLPLLGLAGYRRIAARINVSQEQVCDFCVVAAQRTGRFLYVLARGIVRCAKLACLTFWKGVKEIIAASSPKDE